jgi:hypothetical protein
MISASISSMGCVPFDQASTMVAVVELSFRSWLVAGLVPGLTRQPAAPDLCDGTSAVDPMQTSIFFAFFSSRIRQMGGKIAVLIVSE